MKHLTIGEIEEIPKEFLTSSEVCGAMGICLHSLYNHIHEFPFPVLKIGRIYKIPKQPFVEYLKTGKTF